MKSRALAIVVTLGLAGIIFALVSRRGSAQSNDAGSTSEADATEFEDLFDEFPETDNPDVMRMYLAWRLAERLAGDVGAHGLERQLELFGKLYRRIGRLTR